MNTDKSLVERLRERLNIMANKHASDPALAVRVPLGLLRQIADRLEAPTAPSVEMETTVFAEKLRAASMDPGAYRLDDLAREAADIIDRLAAQLAAEKERADADRRRLEVDALAWAEQAGEAEDRAEKAEAALREIRDHPVSSTSRQVQAIARAALGVKP